MTCEANNLESVKVACGAETNALATGAAYAARAGAKARCAFSGREGAMCKRAHRDGRYKQL